MIDKEMWIFVLVSFTLGGMIFVVLTYIKDNQFYLHIPYIVSGLVNLVMFFLTYFMTKKAIFLKGNKSFFLFSLWE